MMRKAIYIVISFLELLLLIGAFVLQYFTRRRMGMARHIIYMNQKWGEAFSLESIKIVSLILIVFLLMILLFLWFRRENKKNLLNKADIVLSVLLSTVYIVFMTMNSVEEMRAYYFIGILLWLATSLQLLKSWVYYYLIKSKY